MAMAISTKSPSPFFTLLFLLLLSHALLSATAHRCPHFSCGQLRDISYPFRRRDDPPQCEEPRYQLNCQDNKSTISIGSVEYLVTDIQYKLDYDDWMLLLVDPNFVGDGSCGLPSQSLSLSTIDNCGYSADSPIWASFMHCSMAMENEGTYWPVSCPSRYNSTYLYVVIARDGFKLKYLPPPCQFISMIPVTVQSITEPEFNSGCLEYPTTRVSIACFWSRENDYEFILTMDSGSDCAILDGDRGAKQACSANFNLVLYSL